MTVASNAVMFKFREKNSVVDSIKGFGEIDKNTNRRLLIRKRNGKRINKLDQSHISRVTGPKTELLVIKKMKLGKKFEKSLIDKLFQDF